MGIKLTDEDAGAGKNAATTDSNTLNLLYYDQLQQARHNTPNCTHGVNMSEPEDKNKLCDVGYVHEHEQGPLPHADLAPNPQHIP